ARVLPFNDHTRSGEGVESEEAGADDEGKTDQEQPGVAPPPPALADRQGEREADERRRQHEPEVGRTVLPPLVDPGRGAKEADEPKWKQERERPEGPALRRKLLVSRDHAQDDDARASRPQALVGIPCSR